MPPFQDTGLPYTPYHVTLYHATPYHTIPYYTAPYHSRPYQTKINLAYTPHIPHYTIRIVPHHSSQLHIIPYHTVPYHITHNPPLSPIHSNATLRSVISLLSTLRTARKNVIHSHWQPMPMFNDNIHSCPFFSSIFSRGLANNYQFIFVVSFPSFLNFFSSCFDRRRHF